MKKIYQSPELDVVKFRLEDIMNQMDSSTPQDFLEGGNDSYTGDFESY